MDRLPTSSFTSSPDTASMQNFVQVHRLSQTCPRKFGNSQDSQRGTWLATLRTWLRSLGWQESGSWRWRHPDLPLAQATIQWTQPLTQEAIDLENHKLRESWRRSLFNKFLSSSRRDAAAIDHPVYDKKRVQLARHMFRDLDTHGKAVMMGAVVSDARFDVMLRRPIQDCKWCNAGVTPSWEHL